MKKSVTLDIRIGIKFVDSIIMPERTFSEGKFEHVSSAIKFAKEFLKDSGWEYYKYDQEAAVFHDADYNDLYMVIETTVDNVISFDDEKMELWRFCYGTLDKQIQEHIARGISIPTESDYNDTLED